MSFHFSSNFNARDLEREMKQAASAAYSDATRSIERELNGLSRAMKGQSLDAIRPAVRRVIERAGGSADADSIQEYAEGVQRGEHFTVNARPLLF